MKINYKIDEKNKVVIATFTEKLFDIIYNYFSRRNLHINHSLIKRYTENKTIKVKARCMCLDTWDEEVGKQVARQKLINKFKKTIHQIAEEQMKQLQQKQQQLSEIEVKQQYV